MSSINTRDSNFGEFQVIGECLQISQTEDYELVYVVKSQSSPVHVDFSVYQQNRLLTTQTARIDKGKLSYCLSQRGDLFISSDGHSFRSSRLRHIETQGEGVLNPLICWPISVLAISPDSSFIVFGTVNGEIGFVNRPKKPRKVDGAITRIAISVSRIVATRKGFVDIYTHRLEPLGSFPLTIECNDCIGISPNERWIVCGGKQGYSVLDGRMVMFCDPMTLRGITCVAITNESLLFGTSNGRLYEGNLYFGPSVKLEMQILGSISALTYLKNGMFVYGLRNGMIVKGRMFRPSDAEPITPKEPVPKTGASVSNRLVFGTDAKEPVSDKNREVVLGSLFLGAKIPAYNFDEVVRLYVRCGRRLKELGLKTWTDEHIQYIECIQKQCSMIAKKEHAGLIPLLMESVEAQLRLLYAMM